MHVNFSSLTALFFLFFCIECSTTEYGESLSLHWLPIDDIHMVSTFFPFHLKTDLDAPGLRSNKKKRPNDF
ncbi:hypothetical protein BJV82DRAFT_625175 [Fennellomyces sp. T-0311]|nr:hypothetical protein BJV82DRAFT_625175 [Fennellomyces sp. T-0311]